MNVTMQPSAAGQVRRGTGFPVPEVAGVRTPARRMLQRWDRATANRRLHNLWARGWSVGVEWEFTAFGVLMVCGVGAVLLAFR